MTEVGSPAAWIAPEPVVERIALDERSWIDVVRGFVPDAASVHDELLASMPWQQGRVFRYERYVDEPRLVAWCAGDGSAAHGALGEAQRWITRRYRTPFDGVALSQYRNGRDSVGWHRDRELRWLEDTVIGVLTFGATRPFLVRRLTGQRVAIEDDDLSGAIDLHPAAGDLLVMGGRCQSDWLHAVPKVPLARTRISAQWRWTSRRGRPDTSPSYYDARRFSR